jgi:hypothetical protein
LTQNSDSCRHFGSPVRTDFTPRTTRINPRPSDMGGKMKWKLAVRANWMRCSISVDNGTSGGVRRDGPPDAGGVYRWPMAPRAEDTATDHGLP